MRRLRVLANIALELALITLFAGCAQVQPSQGLPSHVPDSVRVSASDAQNTIALLQGGFTQSRLQELQLAGKLPAPIPLDAIRYSMTRTSLTRPKLAFHPEAKVALWASDTNFNYLLGQDSTGLNTITAVDLSKNNCYSPVALKVDHGQNVWVGCELTSTSGTNGAVQEYSTSGVLENQYLPACPAPVKECESFSGYGWDSGLDSGANVFASLNLYSIEICNPSCATTLSAGFEWWPKGKTSAVPRLISVGTNCSPICGVGFMDVDASGNLWFTFSGYDQNKNYGFGLGEISAPTIKPVLRVVEPIGTYGFFGGVYISGAGKTLNVVDQKSRTISQYHLPLAKSGAPFNVIGPTPQNAFGIGDPTSGAFNQLETKIAVADTGGWLDLGVIATNKWSAIANPNFYSGIEGAAYTPSDK